MKNLIIDQDNFMFGFVIALTFVILISFCFFSEWVIKKVKKIQKIFDYLFVRHKIVITGKVVAHKVKEYPFPVLQIPSSPSFDQNNSDFDQNYVLMDNYFVLIRNGVKKFIVSVDKCLFETIKNPEKDDFVVLSCEKKDWAKVYKICY